VAYWLCLACGEKAARWLAGGDDLEKATGLFQRHGPWIVAASRSFPVLPEVVACLAGLARMPARKFFPALACGSLPLGFIYAAIGATGHDRPGLALALSAAVPVVLWLIVQRWMKSSAR
jgi:membrane protein DedA with SNARE-associated domain